MDARAHRGTGKSDPLDARRIAAAVLSLEPAQLRRPRSDDGVRAALRILVTAREHMTTERTATINALIPILRVVDLGIDARKPLTAKQVSEVARWRARAEDLAMATARAEAVRLAKRVADLDEELTANHTRMTDLIRASKAAVLLDKTGIGPVTAAVVLAAWSHSGRVRSESAFAALAGVNPIPASSGNTTRHRLNRGGDRRLNRALHMATITRMTHDPDTRAYVERRRTEGRTTKEIRRCLIGGVSGARPDRTSDRGSRSCRGMASLPCPVRASLSSATPGAPRPRPALGTSPTEGRTMRNRRRASTPTSQPSTPSGGQRCPSSVGTGQVARTM